MTPFCGWLVNGKPCGKPAIPGSTYCELHGKPFVRWEFYEPSTSPTPLTETDIVQRATDSRSALKSFLLEMASIGASAFLVGMAGWLGLFHHAWLYRHREFWWGVLAGGVLEAVIILSRRWAWDRVMWVRWFSR